MTDDRYLELAPLAALGVLDGDDRSSFEAHAGACAACRAELRAHEAVSGLIGLALPAISPAADRRTSLLTHASRSLALGSAVRRHAPWLAAAAALVLAAGALLLRGDRTPELQSARQEAELARREARTLEDQLRRVQQELATAGTQAAGDADALARAAALEAELLRARAQLASLERQLREAERVRLTTHTLSAEVERTREDLAVARQQLAREHGVQQLLARADSRITALSGLPAAPQARGHVLWSPGSREAVLVAAGLEPAPAGKAYEMWVIAQGAPVPAGVFQVDAQGSAVFRLPTLDDTARAKTFAVTLEPAEGTLAPTGPMVLAGNVS